MKSLIREERKGNCAPMDSVAIYLGDGRRAVATVLQGLTSTSLIISIIESDQLELALDD